MTAFCAKLVVFIATMNILSFLKLSHKSRNMLVFLEYLKHQTAVSWRSRVNTEILSRNIDMKTGVLINAR